MVAIDPSAAFRKAIIHALPNAQISVDPFHPVRLANLMVTRVRQRLVSDRAQRRGRKIDPAWAHRMLLLRAYNSLSARAKARLDLVFTTDDPTCELSALGGEGATPTASPQRFGGAGPDREDDLRLSRAGRRYWSCTTQGTTRRRQFMLCPRCAAES